MSERQSISGPQRREFFDHGLLHLPQAIPKRAADAMCDKVWGALEELGVDREDQATWTNPPSKTFGKPSRSNDFQSLRSPQVVGALDALFSVGNWQEPDFWGIPLVTFKSGNTWTLPAKGWHLDCPASSSLTRLSQVTLYSFLSSVKTGGGGTAVIAGSHNVVHGVVASERKLWRSAEVRKAVIKSEPWFKSLWSGALAEREAAGHSKRGHELHASDLTGEPGDVIVAHPWLYHAVAPNCNAEPRIMLLQMIRANESD